MIPSPTPHRFSPERALELGRQTLSIEAAAVDALKSRINGDFAKAVELILLSHGRLIVSGMGKSGHIARKIAATMASTGTPAYIVHPAEASHGDLGMITRNDVLLALSKSGESEELLRIVPLVKRQGARLISMTGVPTSTLAREADIHLDAGVEQEACPHNLAPTASTTAALAMGDALAVALLESRGFTREDFALAHPGGTLGRRLLLRVDEVMHTGDGIPKVGPEDLLSTGLMEMSRKGLGMTAIVDAQNQLTGIFTDGDLRRVLDRGVDVHKTRMQDVMNSSCRSIAPGALAAEAVHLLEQFKINALLVVNPAGQVVGALNIHDLLRAGVM